MRARLLVSAAAAGGVFTREQAMRVASADTLERAVRAGVVARVHPQVFMLSELACERAFLRRAALLYLPRAVISHVDALDVWGLAEPGWLTTDIHVTVPPDHPNRRAVGLRLHRRSSLAEGEVLVRDGVRVTRLERAIVDSWSCVPRFDRRVPPIVAIRERRTTAQRLELALTSVSNAPGRREMQQLFGLLRLGLHSPLELWGHQEVFDHPSLPRASCQFRLETRIGVLYLDRYYDDEMVDVELDGAAYHGAVGQRERDIRRDAGLAAQGILTVRYSHARLFREPDIVRGELRRILDARRRQLAGRSA